MIIDVVGELFIRIIVYVLMDFFLFFVCRVIGWSVIKICTLGKYPSDMWSKEKKYGWVDGLGLLIIVGILVLIVSQVF